MQVLPRDECLAFLRAGRVGVMALARGGEAYAIPLFYAFDGHRLYFQSHPGHKDEFLDDCDEACFVVLQVEGDDDWRSVQAAGPVEKITLSDDATKALDAMARNPFPPEFGVDAKGNPKRSAERMYLWMMTPRTVTGRASRSKT